MKTLTASDKDSLKIADPAPVLSQCDGETAEIFEAADQLYAMAITPSGKGFGRSAVFSYCFAVENEIRLGIGVKLRKLLNKGGAEASLRLLLEPRGQGLSPFFQRYLILARKRAGTNPLEYASLENYLHVLARMSALGPKYKPDGLKAFGVILTCLAADLMLGDPAIGRGHRESANANQIRACLRLRLTNITGAKATHGNTDNETRDDAVRKLACALMKLQHLRNPYIHPQSGEMKEITEVRTNAEQCLNGIRAFT